MFRGSVKSTGYPLHSPVSPFTSPLVRLRVPSHFNWSLIINRDRFGGRVVIMLASGTRVRGFKPGRSRWGFLGHQKNGK